MKDWRTNIYEASFVCQDLWYILYIKKRNVGKFSSFFFFFTNNTLQQCRICPFKNDSLKRPPGPPWWCSSWEPPLPLQGTWVWALVREDPTCCGTAGPVRHNYWACALEPASHNYWAHAPRARAPQQEKPPQWEACAPQGRVEPPLAATRESPHEATDPMQPKINK